MQMLMWVMALFVLLVWLVLCIRALPGLLRSVSLAPSTENSANSPAQQTENPPRVSILLSARNESRALGRTLASLREQTWPNLEVIAVNDRSTDNSGDILEEFSAKWSNLHVIHITDLPNAWLGKNYALYTASRMATGDWLLFTDADVWFHPQAVATAMARVLEPGGQSPEHLALAPRIVADGFWLRAAVYLFLYNVITVFKPQDASNPKSSAFVGIGAFNLIRRDVYQAIDGHRSVAMRPDEDLAIGAVIKHANFRQEFCGGTALLTVEWYPTLREMAHGLEKNSLAPFQYRMWKFSLGVLMFLVTYCGPALGVLLVPGWPRGVFALALAVEIIMFRLTRRYSGVSTWWALSLPLAGPVLFYMMVRSAILCLVRGGIDWRGTFYSLRDLRDSSS